MKEIYKILNQDITVVYESKGVLSRAWLLYLIKGRVSPMVWEMCLISYYEQVKKTHKNIKVSDDKGNLSKALCKDDMPWQRFCQGMSVCNPNGFKMKIKVVLDKTTFEVEDTVGFTYKHKRGDILSKAWVKIRDKFPDQYKNWNQLVKDYQEKGSGTKSRNADSLANNLKTNVNKDFITWNNFITAVMVFNFDVIEIYFEGKVTDVMIKVK